MVWKRGRIYYYKFVFNGEEVYKSTKQGNERIARQIEAARRTELALGVVGLATRQPAPAFAEFTARFMQYVESEKKQDHPGTFKFYGDMVRNLLRYGPLASLPLDRIDEPFVAGFVEWRLRQPRRSVRRQAGGGTKIVLLDGPVEGSTINRELATLRRILNLAVRWKVITSAPRITLPFAERQCERVLSHEQEHEYVSAAAVPLKHFVIIILETGLRPGECLRIRWEYVHFEPAGQGRFGYVHNPLGKTKRAKRNVPLTSKAKAILEMRWEMAGRPKSGWVFADESGETCMSYDVLDSAHDRLMLVYPPEKRFRLYDLRHTLLTRLGESGSNVFAIQNVAGHADLKTTGRYVHPTPEHIEDAFSRLDAYNRRKHVEREEASSSAAARLN